MRHASASGSFWPWGTSGSGEAAARVGGELGTPALEVVDRWGKGDGAPAKLTDAQRYGVA